METNISLAVIHNLIKKQYLIGVDSFDDYVILAPSEVVVKILLNNDKPI